MRDRERVRERKREREREREREALRQAAIFLYNPRDPFINPDDIARVIAQCRGAPRPPDLTTSSGNVPPRHVPDEVVKSDAASRPP